MDYLSLLAQVHAYLLPRTYVEIGVQLGKSFAEARPETLKVGIDPILKTDSSDPSQRYFGLESDAFFEQQDLRQLLDGQPVDLAFIDGMHVFEFVLRDFMNLERFCAEDSVILIHDCYPHTPEMTSREPIIDPDIAWTGDVWKLISCLKQHRPDLEVAVADAPPTGLGIVTSLDPASSLLQDRYEEICEAFVPLDYETLEEGKEEKLNVVPATWDVIKRMLRAPNRY